MEAIVYRKRTLASALMMLFALALGASGYLLVGLNQDGAPPALSVPALAIWFGSRAPWPGGGALAPALRRPAHPCRRSSCSTGSGCP